MQLIIVFSSHRRQRPRGRAFVAASQMPRDSGLPRPLLVGCGRIHRHVQHQRDDMRRAIRPCSFSLPPQLRA
jgi:hypothetical protein